MKLWTQPPSEIRQDPSRTLAEMVSEGYYSIIVPWHVYNEEGVHTLPKSEKHVYVLANTNSNN